MRRSNASVDAQALHLLTNLLAANVASIRNDPAFIPPPSHLAFLLTLTIHPSLNTRAKHPSLVAASDLAHQYLRLVLKTVGPQNADLRTAYEFPGIANSNRRGAGTHRRRALDSPEKESADTITSAYASESSLFAMAGDFWAAVGWAFNCSIAHQRRWERWRLWLEYLLNVLEDDWEALDEEDKADSLIAHYVTTAGQGGASSRRMVRSIFADGGKRSMAEFKEVWRNETRERRTGGQRTEKSRLDIEEGNYGDYLASSEEDEIDKANDDQKPSSHSEDEPVLDSTAPDSAPDGTLLLGGFEAVALRMRLLALLANVAITLSRKFIPLVELYDLYLEHIRPFPLPTFSALISPPALTPFPLAAASSLVQYIARSLLEIGAPLPSLDSLSQPTLESAYLPWAANTTGVADNAKVGVCVETLVRFFDRKFGLTWSQALENVVEDGIRRREEKGRRKGRRKGEAGLGSGGIDEALMRAGGERLRMVVKLAKG